MKQCNCPRCTAKRQQEMKAPIFEEDRYFEEEKWYQDDKEDRWYPEDREDRWYPEEKKEEKRPEEKEEEEKRPERHPERRPEEKEEERRPERRPERHPGKRPERHPGRRPEEKKEEKCKVVYEPTVHCREEKEFHHCVKHIVPVVCKKVENHHYNHEYVIDKKVVKEEHRFDHGKRKEDWCKVAGCGNCHKEEDFGDDGDCY